MGKFNIGDKVKLTGEFKIISTDTYIVASICNYDPKVTGILIGTDWENAQKGIYHRLINTSIHKSIMCHESNMEFA